MGIFDKIKHAIFGDEAKAATLAPETVVPTAPVGTNPATPTPVSPGGVPGMSAPAPAVAPTPAASAPVSSAAVDIAPILDQAVIKSGQKLDWRHSIVDLMKAVGLDASLADRKELAAELNYTGDTHDSAAMNTWLHKALMNKLKENGGKVPAELAD
jgi:hypothetical protein